MKKSMALTLAVAMTASLTACGSSSKPAETTAAAAAAEAPAAEAPAAEAPAAEKVSVKFGNTQSETDLQSQSLLAVAEKLSAATDGNFTAETFFSSSLGDTDDLLEQVLVQQHRGEADAEQNNCSRLVIIVKQYAHLTALLSGTPRRSNTSYR